MTPATFMLLIQVWSSVAGSHVQQHEFGPFDEETCDRIAYGVNRIAGQRMRPSKTEIWAACFPIDPPKDE